MTERESQVGGKEDTKAGTAAGTSAGRLLQGFRRTMEAVRKDGPGHVLFWFLALLIGLAAGAAAVLFRHAILLLERLFYGTDDVHQLHSLIGHLEWYRVVGVPVLGGIVVGIILHRFTPDGRVRSVADVIEGAALRDGRVEKRAGIASALASLITLSTGGSTGREGPVVHMAGLIATWVSDRIHASPVTARDLLGCGVAAAVSASFNAPIAGTLFALEVILRHFAVHAFGPIVIASVAGTVVSRASFGDITEFTLPTERLISFYAELPAFMLLGLFCGIVAVVLMRSVFWATDLGDAIEKRTRMPFWLRPAIAGLLLGLIALRFPHIIGVGYETTTLALTGQLSFGQAIIFTIVKVIAVAITMAGLMGGGIFSPSLMVGALAGLAFGHVAISIFPDLSGSETMYALAGMGAVAAAVLGAPISTTLIVFELTGNWETGLAVMVAVSLSVALASRIVDRSFFLTLLERRNIHLAAGPQAYLLQMFSVARVMTPKEADGVPPEEEIWERIEQGIYVDGNATLEAAMPIFEKSNLGYIPVVTLSGEGEGPELWGVLYQVDALKAYNRALAETAAEEHG